MPVPKNDLYAAIAAAREAEAEYAASPNILSAKCAHALSDLLAALDAAQQAPPAAVPTITREEAREGQKWKGMGGAIAYQLIERHAENWSDVGLMMDAWLEANTPAPPAAVPDAWVPLHPKTGPLWSMATAEPSTERMPSYALAPVYLQAPPAAVPVGYDDDEIADACMMAEVPDSKYEAIITYLSYNRRAMLAAAARKGE